MAEPGQLEAATGASFDVGSDDQVAPPTSDAPVAVTGTAVTVDRPVPNGPSKQRNKSATRKSSGVPEAGNNVATDEQGAEKAKPEKRTPYANPTRVETGGPKRVRLLRIFISSVGRGMTMRL
jgi:hypothetical protein